MIRCVVSHDPICPLPIRQTTRSHGLLPVSHRVGKAGVGDALRGCGLRDEAAPKSSADETDSQRQIQVAERDSQEHI